MCIRDRHRSRPLRRTCSAYPRNSQPFSARNCQQGNYLLVCWGTLSKFCTYLLCFFVSFFFSIYPFFRYFFPTIVYEYVFFFFCIHKVSFFMSSFFPFFFFNLFIYLFIWCFSRLFVTIWSAVWHCDGRGQGSWVTCDLLIEQGYTWRYVGSRVNSRRPVVSALLTMTSEKNQHPCFVLWTLFCAQHEGTNQAPKATISICVRQARQNTLDLQSALHRAARYI